MYQCALFIKSIATKDSKGLYEITNEWSPEHGPVDVTAFAQQTSYELLDEIMKGHKELGEESPLTSSEMASIQDLYKNFDKGLWTETYNGKTCISEWKNNALSDPGHRHLSHLMCLYPFSQVSAFDQTEEGKLLFKAAYNGQIARNGDVTGWSMGWQTNTYSRCLDGDRARKNLSLALRHSGSYVIEMGNYGGCYYNLFDAHSPFQIDGNYGCTSGIAEMLLQSYDDIISMLPALPTAWTTGNVMGLKAQGNFEVNMLWQNSKLYYAEIISQSGAPLRLRNTSAIDLGVAFFYVNCEKVTATQNDDGTFSVDMKKGDKLVVSSENIDEQMITAIDKVSATLPSCKDYVYDLAGRRYSSIAGRYGIHVVNGQKKMLR
jgi:alpha-L-fucosidase 2